MTYLDSTGRLEGEIFLIQDCGEKLDNCTIYLIKNKNTMIRSSGIRKENQYIDYSKNTKLQKPYLEFMALSLRGKVTNKKLYDNCLAIIMWRGLNDL